MKRATFILLLLVALLPLRLLSQNVLVTGALVGNGSYADLGTAFTAINSGAQTGSNIEINITGNTLETVTASLNQGAWTSLTIQPSGGASRSIMGDIAGMLIQFNSADNILIDGLNTGGNALIINNSSIGTAATLNFNNDAQNITVQNCSILGATTSVTSGTILMGTGTGTGGGNDNITFSLCLIDASSSGTPVNAVYSAGLSTTGQENSNVAFNACNIPNFFSASQFSGGIVVAAGSTNWSITNCKFYQSIPRAYTTANTHRAIRIQTGDNHLISGNVIGYASSAGTGTYTMTSAVATRFIGIEVLSGTAIGSSVQGNTISAISLTTSSGAATTYGILCGISITGGNVNIGDITGNIIGGATGTNLLTATSTTTQGAVVGIHQGSTGTLLIINNTIGGLSSSGITAAVAGGIYGIVNSVATTSVSIINNIIGNSTADNMRGGTNGLTTGNSVVSGIYLASSPNTCSINGNTIQNLVSYGTGTSGYVRGIWTYPTSASAAVLSISGNTIANLNTNSAGTSLANGYTSAVGINIAYSTNSVVDHNLIHSISNTNAGAAGTFVAGITHGNSTNCTFSNNTIYNIRNASTSVLVTNPGIAAGIIIRSGTTAITVKNNMISLGTGATDNTAFVGILANHGSAPDPADYIYHNTINITGTVTAGAQPSFGIARTDFSATARTVTVDIRNNIITNTRSGGTGFHYALANNYGATPSTTGWGANASNNNVLNANASTIGWWGANQSMSGWRAISSGDQNSVSGISVPYVNPANDLHLNFGVTPTMIESGGQSIAAVTSDIDGQVRPGPAGSVNGGAFAPDFGADEIDAVWLDGIPPIIDFSLLKYTCNTGDRILTANIADVSGTAVAGILQPRIYYKKNAGAWFSTQGILTSGTSTNGTWTFTIVAADMGGLAIGDVISYFLIAQDLATTPNVGSSPSSGLIATDVNTVTTPPTTPYTYNISSTLNGTFTVGTAGNYATLGAAVNAYNTSCLTGPVVFSLIDPTYGSETLPINILSNEFSSSVNTLTIKPAVGNNPWISGSSTTAMIILNGADYVNIDGSNGNVVNSICPRVQASRDLTIANNNASTTTAVVSFQTDPTGDGASHNQIANCVINGNASLTTGVAVNLSGPTIGSSLGVNQNSENTIANNQLQQAQIGIYSSGASVANKNKKNQFFLNDMNSSGLAALGRCGIMVLNEDSCGINANNIGNINNSGTLDIFGISVGLNSGSNGLTAGAEVTNAIISGNNIDSLVQSGTYSSIGINLGATNYGITEISNNMVNQVFSNGTAGDFACGIFYGGGAGLLKIYNNTVHVTGSNLLSGTMPNMALGINGTTPNIDIRNNILMCSGSNGYDGNTAIGLGYTSAAGNYVNLLSDHNILYISGTGSVIGRTNGLAAGTIRTSLLDWQTETGRDLSSANVNPVFVSASDLHLISGSNSSIEDQGESIVTITTDIDCNIRNCAPDIGADEFGAGISLLVKGNKQPITSGDIIPAVTDSTDFGTQSVCNGSILKNYVIYNTGSTALNISSIAISGPNAPDYSYTAPASTIAPGDSSILPIRFDPSVAGAHNATIEIFSNDCDINPYLFAVIGNGTQVTTVIAVTDSITCYGGCDGSLNATPTGGIGPFAYLWTPLGSPFSNVTGLCAGTYTCQTTDANGCTSTNAITLNAPALIISTQNINLCAGESITIGSHTYSASGVYQDTLVAMNSCDSIITTNLTVASAIDVSTSLTGVTISANYSTANTYQWVDCNNAYAMIAGEINPTFTATTNGDYAVILTIGSCIDTSACVLIDVVGINSLSLSSRTSLHPNPTSGMCVLELPASAQVNISNILGEIVVSSSFAKGTYPIDLQKFCSGVYFVRIDFEDAQHILKLIKE